MKHLPRFGFAFGLLLSFSSVRAQVSTADSLVQKIFASLKAKDQQAFVALYPTAQQFGRFIRNIMEQALNSEEVKKQMALSEESKNLNIDSLVNAEVTKVTSEEGFGKMQSEFGQAFQKVISKGEQKGVNWSEAKLIGYTVDSSAMGANEGVPFGLSGLKEAKGVIDFTVGDSAYQLAYNKMMYIQSEGGWFGAEFPQLARKGESLDPDTPAFTPEDSEALSMAADTAATEPVKKKAKGTTRTTPSKAKPASKSPARKPKAKS